MYELFEAADGNGTLNVAGHGSTMNIGALFVGRKTKLTYDHISGLVNITDGFFDDKYFLKSLDGTGWHFENYNVDNAAMIITLAQDTSATPEPATLLMFGIGTLAAGACTVIRRKRK